MQAEQLTCSSRQSLNTPALWPVLHVALLPLPSCWVGLSPCHSLVPHPLCLACCPTHPLPRCHTRGARAQHLPLAQQGQHPHLEGVHGGARLELQGQGRLGAQDGRPWPPRRPPPHAPPGALPQQHGACAGGARGQRRRQEEQRGATRKHSRGGEWTPQGCFRCWQGRPQECGRQQAQPGAGRLLRCVVVAAEGSVVAGRAPVIGGHPQSGLVSRQLLPCCGASCGGMPAGAAAVLVEGYKHEMAVLGCTLLTPCPDACSNNRRWLARDSSCVLPAACATCRHRQQR
jgi:hypothetical protein